MQQNSTTPVTKRPGQSPQVKRVKVAVRAKDHQAEAKRLASICANPDSSSDEERREAHTTFCVAFQRAREGRIWRPDRVLALYPTLMNIVDEIDEEEREWVTSLRRAAAASRGWETRRARRK